jgi:hypothetical protein
VSFCQAYPTKFEVYDEYGECIVKIEAFDEDSSNVKIDTVMTPETWLEVSVEVHKCLLLIHPEKD